MALVYSYLFSLPFDRHVLSVFSLSNFATLYSSHENIVLALKKVISTKQKKIELSLNVLKKSLNV